MLRTSSLGSIRFDIAPAVHPFTSAAGCLPTDAPSEPAVNPRTSAAGSSYGDPADIGDSVSGKDSAIPYTGDMTVCYILFPLPPRENELKWLESLPERFGVTAVMISGMDWNKDMTPWPAEGLRRGERFSGGAEAFLSRLESELIPHVEHHLLPPLLYHSTSSIAEGSASAPASATASSIGSASDSASASGLLPDLNPGSTIATPEDYIYGFHHLSSGLSLRSQSSCLTGETSVHRLLMGVSLSGLFTIWAGCRSSYFEGLAAVSGSFWYDGFVDWLAATAHSDGVISASAPSATVTSASVPPVSATSASMTPALSTSASGASSTPRTASSYSASESTATYSNALSPLASGPLTSAPLASTPLVSASLTSVPLASTPLVSASLTSVPSASVPLTSAPFATVRKIWLSLGDREKLSRNSRLAVVQDSTEQVASILRASVPDTVFHLEEGTHFSPMPPRFDHALSMLLSDL